MPIYRPKWNAEIGWIVATAAFITGLQMLVGFDPNNVTSWRELGTDLLAAMFRSAVGTLLFLMTRPAPEVDPVKAAERTVEVAQQAVEVVKDAEDRKE